MFLPDSCDFRFSIPINDPVQYISGNREKSLFVIATDSTLFVYLANPHLLACSYKRNDEEIFERGEYRKIYWRHDSKSICVTTTKHVVYIYSIEEKNEDTFNLHDTYDNDYKRISSEFFLKQKRPKIFVDLAVVAKLESIATCVASLKDELFVCLQDGWIHRLSWSGEVLQDLSFNIRNVPFSIDQLHAKTTKLTGLSIHVSDIIYCPLIGGLCCVLSDGRAGLFVSSSHRFQPQNVAAVWALGLKDAVCCSANHKFRLIYFGCQNGEIGAYHLDDANGSLVQTYRISLSIKNSREYLTKLGAVHQIQCISQGYVFAVIWKLRESSSYQNGSLSSGNLEVLHAEALANPPPVVAIFSPFGIQWWCSLEDSSERPAAKEITYNCIEWGPEGFQLWAGSNEGVTLTHLVRSIYINQPSAEYHDRVIMVGADKVMLGPKRKLEKLAKAPYCVWNTFRIPYEYNSLNWPIRFVGIDDDCSRIIAVAGNKGFAYYNLKSSKWKLFRNEVQEQALLVTGGLAVFNDFIVVAGSDLENEEENVFIYSINQQLESSSATKFPVSQRIMMMNLRDDHLLTFDVAATISIFILKQQKSMKTPDAFECQIDRCAEIRINELLPHPTCVISTQLTSLNYHSEASYFCHGMDSLLVNVSGHLLLLSPFNKENSDSDDDSHFQLHQPMLIASQVERVWLQPGHRDIPHLNKAVWINSGIRKMKVWLPLFHNNNVCSPSQNSTKNFIARRIMLPIELNVYPIAIDEDCLACGVESFPSSTTSKSEEELVPILVHNVTRNNEVFIHRLLRQLLKRNLGIYALEIASTCRQLPYFGHILELLLHDVLDEEATSSEPIPDPLLPRVVAFIHEFPEYLQTIVHCARKTELAFWNQLFGVSHHPRELFKMCLKEDQLDTATSCLIILQSMETVASVHHATRLLEETLNKRSWLIARDIVRFLKSIDGTELEVPESPLYMKFTPKGAKPLHVMSDEASDDYNLVFNSISVDTHAARAQHKQSISQQSSYSPNNPGPLEKHRGSISPLASTDQDLIGVSIPLHLQRILERHAHVLLEDYALRDLGSFASHLDFDLLQFFARAEGAFAYPADQFPIILMKLHSQFKWPYPVVGDVIDKLIQKFQQTDMTPSASEDEFFIVRKPPKVDKTARRERQASKPTFEWKVIEKLCAKSKNKTMQVNEEELTYMLDWLAKSNAIEWIYMLSLMYRDLNVLYNLVKDFTNQQRINIFLKKVTQGTEKLLDWAIDSCPPYVSIIQLFMNFLDQLKDMQKFRKISNSTSIPTSIIQRPNGLILNGTANGVRAQD